MDIHRVAAAEQLRSYAAILGVGFKHWKPVGALAQTIEENRGKELIFIDTPGLGAGDLDDSMGLARFLSTREAIDTHLVLSSSMKSADLARMVDAFEVFHPRRLLFTKLDETGSLGPFSTKRSRTGKPLSFFRQRSTHSGGSGSGHVRAPDGVAARGPLRRPALRGLRKAVLYVLLRDV